jgi:hypothetical protein
MNGRLCFLAIFDDSAARATRRTRIPLKAGCISKAGTAQTAWDEGADWARDEPRRRG